MANDDLPEAVNLEEKKATRHNQIVGIKFLRVVEAIAPHLRRLPDADGNLPYLAFEGNAEFIDPKMTIDGLFESLVFPFEVSRRNLEYAITQGFGKLKEEKRPKPAHAGDDRALAALEARVAALEGAIGGWRQVIPELIREVSRQALELRRLEEQKVTKTEFIGTARSHTREEPLRSFSELGTRRDRIRSKLNLPSKE